MAEQQNRRSSLGVLILHGFTGTLESVNALYDPLKALGIPVFMPLLAGHGAASPEALRGVQWDEWFLDAERAMQKLLCCAERIIVIGHSMGALLSLNLAAKYQGCIDSLVLAAPAIKLTSLFAPGRPLHLVAPLVSTFYKNWTLQSHSSDGVGAYAPSHYPWVPTNAILSFFDLIKQTLPLLDRVSVPLLILQCRKESTVLPESATILLNRIATEPSAKSVLWFEHSEHQIFCDGERTKAVQAVINYVSGRISKKGGAEGSPFLI
ncbi:MAG: alpha/beta fold hydrolase [Chlorobium sp.]